MFVKLGELIDISKIEDVNSCIPCVSEEILESFKKTATSLKKIAPKADDFIYFSAIFMHSAEAAALNEDGSPKLTAKGEPVKVSWNKEGGTWKWQSNDPSIKPYKNVNGDIFPEEELVKAYKKWIHKPLCIDHKSNSVDHVRGFIVDTYYDRNLKRIVGLCALDKKNYPDLARKVQTGYSSSVSMGTAVGRAICTDCARVARTESDFCEHMKRKNGYGEINIDLNPIELSIVVNGADPKAHIKHIIAAANTLNTYVETKEQELKKLAENVNYHATVSVSSNNEDPNNTNNQNKQIDISVSDFDQFKSELDKAVSDLADIKKSKEELEAAEQKLTEASDQSTNDTAYNQSSGTLEMDEAEEPSNLGLQPPSSPKFASDNTDLYSMAELKEITSVIEDKLSQMKQSLDQLLANKKEENMSGSKINKTGYYLGTEDPSPGEVQYDKEPLNEKLRTDGDKHMLGQMDTGPVDGMHPGPDSVGMSELERKKMLARAEADERAMKRKAIVDMAKQAYWQSGVKGNDPTPGKAQYPVDKLNEDDRDNEDKQMVGAKPFPGVGKTNEMFPGDKQTKEMLNRASLKARFVKAAEPKNSSWEVYEGDKLVLVASVDELSGGNSEVLFSSIATKEFGKNLLEKIKAQGAAKVSSMIKRAQGQAPAAAPAMPEAPAEMPAAPAEGLSETMQENKEETTDALEKVKSLHSDLGEAINALSEEKKDLEAAPAPTTEMASTASFGTEALQNLRVELNGSLIEAMKEVRAELQNHQEELSMISDMYDRGSISETNADLVAPVIEDALTETKSAIADGFNLMTAFVKYARGTKEIIKRAQAEQEAEELMDTNDVKEYGSLFEDPEELELEEIKDDEDFEPELESLEEVEDLEFADDTNDTLDVKKDQLSKLNIGDGIGDVRVVASLETKAARAELRAKLAAETLKFSPMLDQAHPKGGETTKLDVKPEGDLAKVEDLEEVSKQMNDLANAPPKVRKEAEAIHRLVVEGKLDPKDLDALVAEGLDPAAKAYYTKYFAQTDGGSEFAKELTKEHVKAAMEEQLNTYKLKISRAYELTYDMIERGLCPREKDAISLQVDEIMKFSDESFDSFKRVVAKHAPLLHKEAGRIPQVGLLGSGEVSVSQSDDDLASQLSAALSGSSRKLF